MLHAPALRHATSGLLSARVLLPIVLGNGSDVAHMSQALLQLAADLASRLLPAFNTVTGIPYGEINLRITYSLSDAPSALTSSTAGTVNLLHGVPLGETTVASLAGAGSSLLEFHELSRASGNPIFGAKAAGAMRGLWSRRSSLGYSRALLQLDLRFVSFSQKGAQAVRQPHRHYLRIMGVV